ncbi:MAG TPA: hypothetical protein PLF80_10255, partial [Flavobacteriales bacterium]|nr:hypothetical protein [Flavobacteriales bacterium]
DEQEADDRIAVHQRAAKIDGRGCRSGDRMIGRSDDRLNAAVAQGTRIQEVEMIRELQEPGSPPII